MGSINQERKGHNSSSSDEAEFLRSISEGFEPIEGLEEFLLDRESFVKKPDLKSYVVNEKDGKLFLDTSDPHTKEKAIQILRQMKETGTSSVAVKFDDPLNPRQFAFKGSDKKSGTLIRIAFKARKTKTGHRIEVVDFTDDTAAPEEEHENSSPDINDTISLSVSDTVEISPPPKKETINGSPEEPRTLNESEREQLKNQGTVKAKDSREAAKQVLAKMGRRF